MSHDFRVGESGDSEECSWCGVSRSASGNFRCTDETAPTSRQKSKIDFDWLNALKDERRVMEELYAKSPKQQDGRTEINFNFDKTQFDGHVLRGPYVDPSEKALKFDDHKPPLDLLPFFALEEIAKVLAYGAKNMSHTIGARGLPGHVSPLHCLGMSLPGPGARARTKRRAIATSHMPAACCCSCWNMRYRGLASMTVREAKVWLKAAQAIGHQECCQCHKCIEARNTLRRM